VLAAVHGDRGILGQAASPGDRTGRTLDDSPELDGPLGDGVDIVHDRVVDLVEQLVQGDEPRTLGVPVGVFHLRAEVDAIRQTVVEQFDGLLADRRIQVILGLEHWRTSRGWQGIGGGRIRHVARIRAFSLATRGSWTRLTVAASVTSQELESPGQTR
jgi:hypothetical protein